MKTNMTTVDSKRDPFAFAPQEHTKAGDGGRVETGKEILISYVI